VGETRKHKRALERQSEGAKASLNPPAKLAELEIRWARISSAMVNAAVDPAARRLGSVRHDRRVHTVDDAARDPDHHSGHPHGARGAMVVWARGASQEGARRGQHHQRRGLRRERKAALAQLDASYRKNDTTAIFARAQLEMQDDPKKALATLERIDLSKVLGTVADETRAQRAMIHLTMGDVGPARQLVDNIDLGRQRDAKTRAMLTAVCARPGHAPAPPKRPSKR